jgi:membrane protein involved in colicin uptake
MTQRTKATDGTQAHRDLATIKNNINYWIKVAGMDRDEAKAKVMHPNYQMMDAETINREVAAEARRQANIKARQEREAEAEAKAKAQKKNDEPKKNEEPKAKMTARIKGTSVVWNGNVYKNLADAIRASSPKYQGAENRAAACKRWTIVRAGLLKNGLFQDATNTFSM